jgi:enamine deaminase RidA (YjgF/YER057c/UK114 family)
LRRLISSGSPFERDIGYSRAVVQDEWVFVSGTTGFDYDTMHISEDVIEQTEQCLRNIGRALEEAGSSFDDVVRVRYVLPRAEDFEPCWPACAAASATPAGGYDDRGRSVGPAHEDRDRGHGS